MLLYKCHQGVLQRVLGGSICYLNSVHEATAQEALRLVTSFKRSCAGVPGTSTLNELIVPEDKKLNAIWSSGYSCNPNTTAVDLPKEVIRFVIPPDAHQQFPWSAYVHHAQRGKFNPMIPWVDAPIDHVLANPDEPERAVIEEPTTEPSANNQKIECIKRPYQPNVLKRKRQSGFLARLRSRTGRKILSRRRRKGRRRLSA